MAQGNLYPLVSAKAQPEVKAAIKRFMAMPERNRAQAPLLYWLIGGSTQTMKMDKADAAYEDPGQHGSQRCGNCRHAWTSTRDRFHICALVQGEISTCAYCSLWEA